MAKEKKVKYFIPAMALEHPANPEIFSLHQKLKFAIIRYFINGDYLSLVSVPDPLPGVLLEQQTFNKKMLGYDICAIIRSG